MTSIAILGTRGVPARYGGFETFAEELAARLVAAGVRVTVYCEAEQPGAPAIHRGANLVYIPAPRLGSLRTIVFDVRCLWHSRGRSEVVYMLGYGTSFACFLPRAWGSRVWINMDGLEWRRSKWSPAAKLWLRTMEWLATVTANAIVCDAEAIRRSLASRYKRLPPAHVIPYGAPLVVEDPGSEVLKTWNLTSGSYFLVVCRIEPENHVLEIVRGFGDSSVPQLLVIVGDDSISERYVEQIKRIADARVRFIGPVYDRTMLESLRYHCRGYFHGHSVGGTNPSLLEAMGCGNVVIAHDNEFNREVAGDCAYFFSRESDIPGAVAAIARMDSAERESRAKAVRSRIADCYSWDKVAARYLARLRGDDAR